MSRIQKCLWAAAALAVTFLVGPDTASARGPIRYVVGRPVWRAPVTVVRTARVVTPPFVPYYAPHVYVQPRVYVPQPYYVAPVIYIH
jgi:hypothetical protein